MTEADSFMDFLVEMGEEVRKKEKEERIMEKEIEKNRVLVGKKSKSTYLQTILYIHNNNNVSSISVEGLGRQSQKALETAERAEKLVPQLELKKVENIEKKRMRWFEGHIKSNRGWRAWLEQIRARGEISPRVGSRRRWTVWWPSRFSL